eukprot:3268154-Prymnesium_polylepis.1
MHRRPLVKPQRRNLCTFSFKPRTMFCTRLTWHVQTTGCVVRSDPTPPRRAGASVARWGAAA